MHRGGVGGWGGFPSYTRHAVVITLHAATSSPFTVHSNQHQVTVAIKAVHPAHLQGMVTSLSVYYTLQRYYRRMPRDTRPKQGAHGYVSRLLLIVVL